MDEGDRLVPALFGGVTGDLVGPGSLKVVVLDCPSQAAVALVGDALASASATPAFARSAALHGSCIRTPTQATSATGSHRSRLGAPSSSPNSKHGPATATPSTGHGYSAGATRPRRPRHSLL